MGTVKIELDLPHFEKEIELKVIINKDGVQSSTPLIDKKVTMQHPDSSGSDCGNAWKQSMTSEVCTNPDIKTDAYGYMDPYTPHQPAAPTVNSSPKIPSSMMGTF